MFLANFRYDVKDTVPLSDYTGLEPGDYDLFDSRCDQTLVGFFKSADGQYHCALAEQISATNSTTVVSEDEDSSFVKARRMRPIYRDIIHSQPV